MEGIRAGLSHDIDDPACKPAIFRIKRAGEKPEFLDCVQYWNHRGSIVVAALDRDPIYLKGIRTLPLTIDRKLAPRSGLNQRRR